MVFVEDAAKSGASSDVEVIESVGSVSDSGAGWRGALCRVRRGFDRMRLEDLPHGGGHDRDAEHGEFAVDAPVTPAGGVRISMSLSVSLTGGSRRAVNTLVSAR